MRGLKNRLQQREPMIGGVLGCHILMMNELGVVGSLLIGEA
jgi:hypothetical protein